MRTLSRAAAVCGVLVATGAWPLASTGGFRDVAASVGLHFVHENGASGDLHLPEIMGAGGALLDFDGDGDLDILLLQGRALDGTAREHAGTSGHRLFRNDLAARGGRTGRLHFTDVTAHAGFGRGDYGMGVAVGDYDNDNDPDLYVTNYGPNHLYRNNGDGTFSDVTVTAGKGLDDPRWSTSATFNDYDADGDLDLFVANYVDFTVPGKRCFGPSGARDYCGPLQYRPVPDRLFRNSGDGTFVDVSESSGIVNADGPGLGVSAADFTGDHRIDIYVANDGTANQLWVNTGDGRFEDGALMAGVALSLEGQAEGSMGLAIGDPDTDGDFDIFVTNIARESHVFYEHVGRGHFEDRRLATALGPATRRYTGFGTDWFDYDNDGYLDLFIANGGVAMSEAAHGNRARYHQRNQLLRNVGSGRFEDATATAGSGLDLVEVSRGAAFGDVDNDGDVDVLVTNNGGPARLLLNESRSESHWLQVRLQGVADNRQGLGAMVGLVGSDGRTVWRRAHADGSYLSASDSRVHFALPDRSATARLVVHWPRGLRERWTGLQTNQTVTLTQGGGRAESSSVEGERGNRR